ncbi:MAG: hypothetical protein IPO06_19770 [Leptospiraceae bacterium]|nr:hypothetical protein [Leptospiraceae bacterium]
MLNLLQEFKNIIKVLEEEKIDYAVFGGMVNSKVDQEDIERLQSNG